METRRTHWRADEFSLDWLSGTLRRIKKDNGYISDDLFCLDFSFGSPLEFHNLTQATAQLKGFFSALDSIESISNILEAMLQSITREKIVMKKRFRPLAYHVGIHSLPNEILERIFECSRDPFGFNDHKNVSFPINISHVCRRFRDIALHISDIWTDLSSAHSNDQLSAFIQRSKSAELYISMIPRPSVPFSEFVYTVVPHIGRWRELEIVQGREAIIELMENPSILRGLTIPNLTKLTLSEQDNASFFKPELGSDNLFGETSLPSLKHLSCINIIPTIALGGELATIELSLEHQGEWGLGIWAAEDLFEFLQNCPLLETLSLKSVNAVIHDRNPRRRVIKLPKLKTLFVEIDHNTSDADDEGSHRALIECIFRYLDCPALSTLRISIMSTSNEDIHFLKRHMFHAENTYSSVQYLDIRIPFNPVLVETILLRALRTLTSLKHLSVESPYLELIDPLKQLRSIPLLTGDPELLLELDWPPLQTLRFTRCDRLDIHRVCEIIQRFRSDQTEWEKFEMLEIRNCRRISQEQTIIEKLRVELGERFIFVE